MPLAYGRGILFFLHPTKPSSMTEAYGEGHSVVGLPTSGSQPQTSGSRLPTSGFDLPTSSFRLPTSSFQLPTPVFQLHASARPKFPKEMPAREIPNFRLRSSDSGYLVFIFLYLTSHVLLRPTKPWRSWTYLNCSETINSFVPCPQE